MGKTSKFVRFCNSYAQNAINRYKNNYGFDFDNQLTSQEL